MTASPDIKRAARLAAERIEAMLITMLEAGQVGEAAIKVLSPYELKPVKRVEDEMRSVRVASGHSVVERVAER